jgi:hypothetical protein
VGFRAVLDAVVKRKIPSPRRESNPRTPIVQPIAQRYTTELSRLLCILNASYKCISDIFKYMFAGFNMTHIYVVYIFVFIRVCCEILTVKYNKKFWEERMAPYFFMFKSVW